MTDARVKGDHRTRTKLGDVVPWKNVDSEDVPAYGVIQLRTDFADGVSRANKPNASSGLFFVNGPVPIAANGFGESLLWNRPQRVLVSGDVSVGDEVGPVDGSWSMSTGGNGYFVLHQSVYGIAVVVQVGGGGGSPRIRFVIEEVVCYGDTIVVYVRWTHYSGGCGASPPGILENGLIEVEDSCIFGYFPAEDLIGKIGSASYWSPRDYCTQVWIVDDVCGTPECA